MRFWKEERMWNTRMRRQARGFTIIEIMIALAVAVIVMSIGITTLGAAGHGFSRQSSTIKSQTAMDRLVEQLSASGHTSVSIFTPLSCDNDIVNHGDNKPCTQVRFAGLDKTGADHFWGWEFTGGVLKECLDYTRPDANCKSYGPSTNLLSFRSTPTTIDQLALSSALGMTTIAKKEQEVSTLLKDPNNRVVAGNRVMVVTLGDANTQREIHLLQGGAPFSTAVVKGTFKPPTLGSAAATTAYVWLPTSASVSCYAPNGTAITPCTATITETNYGAYIASGAVPAPYWTVNTQAGNSNTIWNGSLVASDNGVFKVSGSSVGNGSASISSYDQTNIPINIAVAGPVTANPSTFTISSGGSVNGSPQSLNVTHSKTFDPFALTMTAVTAAGSCPFTAATPITGAASGNPANPATVLQGFSALNIPAGTAPQVCTYTMVDQYGETDITNITTYSALKSGTPSGISNSTTSIDMTSNAPSGGTATGYSVTYYFQGGAVACGPATYNCTINGLAGNTSYNFYATYKDSVGDLVSSAIYTVKTKGLLLIPGVPRSANNSPTVVPLDSTAPTGGTGTGYTVTYTNVTLGTSGPVSFAFSFNNGIPATTYNFTVTYRDSGGNSVTIPFTAITLGASTPLSAGNPVVTGTSATQITLNSTPPANGSGTGYNVTYTTSAGSCGPVAYACTISGLAPGTNYTITATYHDSAGNTAIGTTTGTTSLAGPNPLIAGTPNVSGATTSSLNLNSSAPSNGSGNGYNVTYVTNTGQTCGPVAYACTISGLASGRNYIITATYHDSAANTAITTITGTTTTGVAKFCTGPYDAFGYVACPRQPSLRNVVSTICFDVTVSPAARLNEVQGTVTNYYIIDGPIGSYQWTGVTTIVDAGTNNCATITTTVWTTNDPLGQSGLPPATVYNDPNLPRV